MNSDNKEQEEIWNGRLGEGFLNAGDYIDRMVAPFTKKAIETINPNKKDRILDVGCGGGSTTILLASAGAETKGIDISEKMISSAKNKSKGISNISFEISDAENISLTPIYSKIFSRFGVMFFSNPIRAFRNIKKGLRPGGSITFICWQSMGKNHWINFAAETLLPFQPQNLPKANPRSPGGFAFGEKAYIEEILSGANYTNIQIDPLETEFDLGKSVEEIMFFNKNVGPLSGLLQSLDDSDSVKAMEVLRDKVKTLMNGENLFLPAAAWLVTAKVE